METTEITTHTFGDIELRGFTDENGDPLFVAADVAKALDYRETHDMTRILAEDEIADPRLVRVSSSNQHGEFERDVEMTIITESGLYRAIFKSTKPEAEKFRLWVFRDVLPSIRKHGYYILENELAEEKARNALCHKEIARLMDANATERVRVTQPARLAEAKTEALAHKKEIKTLEADAAASVAYAASMRANDAVVENEELRKLKRHLQAELRQKDELVAFLQRKLQEAYSAEVG